MGRAEELKREGVDVATRSKVGAVSGAMAGVGAVIPMGGSGLASTAALVGVGGPGMAIAQGAAEKAILKNADYGHLADQIDPLDPVNLAAATLMAGAFGGLHLAATRRAATKAGVPASAAAPVAPAAAPDLTSMAVEARKGLRYNDPSIDAYAVQAAQREGVPPALMLALKNAGEKSGSTAVSPKGAAGVAQLMPENQAKFGITDAADPVQSLDGMAKYLAATMKQYDGNTQINATTDALRQRFNAAGGNVGQLDYGYVPIRHSQLKVLGDGSDRQRAAWAEAVLPLLDKARYLDDAGNPMAAEGIKPRRQVLTAKFSPGGTTYGGGL